LSRNLYVAISIVVIVLVALGLLGGLVWANSLYARQHPTETEFLLPWLGARTFLQYGESPYADPSTQRAQIQYYGRLADAGQDPLRLSLPFPIEVLYFPFTMLGDPAWARGAWMALVEIGLAALGWIGLRLTGWKAGRFLLPAVMLFPVLWIYGPLSFLNGSGTGLAVLAIAGALLALRAGRDELAGALLFPAFFRPDLGGALLVLLLVWTLSARRGRVLAGLAMALAILFLISFLLLPGWFFPFLQGLVSHYQHADLITPGRIFAGWWPAIGARLGWVLTGGVALLLLLEWRAALGRDFRHLLWTACLTLAATPLLGIPLSIFDYGILFLPFLLGLAVLAERWNRRRQWLVSGLPLAVLFLAPWLAAFRSASLQGLVDFLALAMPLLLLLLLYWIRWWAIRPPRTWLETARGETE